MSKKTISIIFFALSITTSSCYLHTVWRACNESWKRLYIADSKDHVFGSLAALEAIITYTKQSDDPNIEERINSFEESMRARFELMKGLLEPITGPRWFEEKKNNFLKNIMTINELYQTFLRSHNPREDGSQEVFQNYPRRLMSTLNEVLEDLRLDSINPKKGTFILIAKVANNTHQDHCGHHQSPKYVLMMMLQSVMIAELQAAAMYPIGYNMLLNRGSKQWREQIGNTKLKFGVRFREYAVAIDKILNIVPGDIRACDPKSEWIRDKTYFEAEKFVQSSILAPSRTNNSGSYRYLLKGVNTKQPKTCNDLGHLYNNGRIQRVHRNHGLACNGYIGDCEILDPISAGCLSVNSVKRIEWLKLANSIVWGDDRSECSNQATFSDPIYSRQSNCICHCFEDNNWIGLGISTADYDNNMVITGLRLIRVKRTFYIQTKQGKLVANGQVDPASQIWMDPPISNTLKFPVNFKPGHHNNIFALDDIIVPYGSVIIGVGFGRDRREGEKMYKILARTIEFNFGTGQLDINKNNHQLLGMNHSVLKRDELRPLSEMKSSIDTDLPNVPSPTNTYIRLTRSALESDVGQSTLPLFDGVPVETDPPTPLGGVGFFHKGRPGYGGFLSLRLHSIPYGKYLREFGILHG